MSELLKDDDIIRTTFKHKPAIAELNVKASMMGADYVKRLSRSFPIKLEDKTCAEDVMIIGGNDAVVAGLIAGGVNFFSGYPMSPATTVLEKMVKTEKNGNIKRAARSALFRCGWKPPKKIKKPIKKKKK